jgi:hypothetical protein
MDTDTRRSLSQLLAVLPIIIIKTMVDMIIAFALAMMVFMHLVLVAGWDKRVSEGVALLTATVVYLYIWLQPKIRNYISARSQ